MFIALQKQVHECTMGYMTKVVLKMYSHPTSCNISAYQSESLKFLWGWILLLFLLFPRKYVSVFWKKRKKRSECHVPVLKKLRFAEIKLLLN